MNPRVLIEQNAVSGKIVNVRENARFLPLREKWLVNHVRISSEKRRFPSKKGHFDGKWRLFSKLKLRPTDQRFHPRPGRRDYAIQSPRFRLISY
jgi:hypothetical protein